MCVDDETIHPIAGPRVYIWYLKRCRKLRDQAIDRSCRPQELVDVQWCLFFVSN